MKTLKLFGLLGVAMLYGQAKAQFTCNSGTLNLNTTSTEHTVHDPAQFPDAYVFVDLEVFGKDDVTIGEPEIEQHYYTGATPLSIDFTESTLLTSIQKDQTAHSYVVLKCANSELPFYPVKTTLSFPVFADNEEPLHHESIVIYVWFTAWGTVEVWNSSDFHTIKRQWLTPVNGQEEPARIAVDPNTIPASDVPNEPIEDAEWWYYEPNLAFIEGLPFAVPMMRTEAPANESWLSEGRADDCGFGKQRFKYKIEGNLKSYYEAEPINNQIEIPLSGLSIALFESDLGENNSLFDEYIDTKQTDANGNFVFEFDVCQSTIFEGNNIEPYFKVYAKDQSRGLYGKRGGNSLTTIGNATYSDVFYLGSYHTTGNDQETKTENITLDQGIHLTVVQAAKAVDFCTENNVPVAGNINLWTDAPILQYTESTAFVPNVIGIQFFAAFPGGRNTMVIESNDEGVENTIWHEFGHHVMYSLQNGNYVNFLVTTLDHDAKKESNANLAWTEGWASAFGYMCDYRNYSLDNECRFDLGFDIERRNYNVTGNYDFPALGNGFKNETHIACSIYDLFDSDQKRSQYSIPQNYLGNNDLSHLYAYDQWENCSEDNRDYSLLSICAPLMNHNTSNDLITNVGHYLKEFSAGQSSSEKLKTYASFRENRLCISKLDKMTACSADKIGINQHLTDIVNPTFFESLGYTYPPVTVDEIVFVNLTIDNAKVFNLNFGTQAPYGDIIEDAIVTGTGKLLLNHNTQGLGGLISDPSQAINTSSYSLSDYTVLVRENATLSAGASSTSSSTSQLIVGENNQNKVKLYIKSGSKLEVGNNDEVIVNSGSKIIIEAGAEFNLYPNSNLIIEDGAEVIFEAGSTINIADNASIVVNSTTEPVAAQLIFEEGVNYGNFANYCELPEFGYYPITNPCNMQIEGNGGTYIPNCVSVSAGDDVINPTDCAVTLTASTNLSFTAGVTYDWYRLGNNNQITYVGSGLSIATNVWQTTVFKIVVTDPFGGVYEDFMSVHRAYDPACIPDFHNRTANYLDNLNAYPNPTTGPLTVSFDVIQKCNVNLEIFNSSGILQERIVNNVEYDYGSYTVNHDISNYQTGNTFYVVISGGDEILQTQIVKL